MKRILYRKRRRGASVLVVAPLHLVICLLLAGAANAPAMVLYDMDQIHGDVRVLGAHAGSRLGRVVASGDFNGDDFIDVAISSPSYQTDLKQLAVGAVFVVFGSGGFPPAHQIDLFDQSVDITVFGRQFGDNLGSALAVGDLNDDGIDDLIMAGDGIDPGGTQDAGAVFVLFGSTGFTSPQVVDLSLVSADMEIYGAAEYDHTGYRLGTGDLNGDGVDDLVFSILGHEHLTRTNCGAAGVIFGSSGHASGYLLELAADQPDVTVVGAARDDWLASALALGDINGDGLDDLLLSAVFADPLGREKAGTVALLEGRETWSPHEVVDLSITSPAVLLLGASANDRIGFSLASGDMNGDGLDDIVVGAHLAGGTSGSEAGRVHVLHGVNPIPPGTVVDLASPTAVDISFLGAHAGDKLGYALALGDFNGDTIDDLQMGAVGLDPPGGEFAGGVFAVYGSDSFPANLVWDMAGSDPDILIYGDEALEQAGVSVAAADLNEDDLDDFLVGAFQHSSATGGDWCGALYGIYGCVEAAVPTAPSPAPGALDVPLEITLGWTAGPEADTYDLHFDTVSPPELYQSGLTEPFFDLPPLVSGQHYYWQVVAKNECSETASPVWDFTTCIVPAVPGSPSPADGATGTALDLLLDWSDTVGADSYTLYFGDSSPPPLYESGIMDSQYDLPVLAEGITYHWRVEAVNGCGGTSSAEWSFTTCVNTVPPELTSPVDGAVDQPTNPVTLDWLPAPGAEVYDVYFGESNPPLFWQGDLATTYLPIFGLEEGVTFYWQVVARNNCNQAASEIRSFTTIWSPVQMLVTGPGPDIDNPPLVRIFDPGALPAVVSEWSAYGVDKYGVNVAAGDLGWSRLDEVVTGAGPGDVFGPHVRGWEPDGGAIPQVSFLAYGTHKFGVNVACGDIDGDGYDEIVTGAGPGAVFGPHVRAWNVDGDTATAMPLVSFMAYNTLKWGANVACGDIDGDGYDEIVTGPGPGAVFGPHVRGWDVDAGAATADPAVNILAYGTHKYGVNVACGDVDGDGIDEILTGAGPGEMFHSHVRGWNYDGGAVYAMAGLSWLAYDQLTHGVRVGAADVDGDLVDEILTCPGPAAENQALVRGWNYDGIVLELIDTIEFPAYDGEVVRGGNITGGSLQE